MPANWRTKGWRRDTWRRLYVREQGSFASLPFFARATAAMLLKLCDERGRIEVGKSGDLVDAIAFRMGAEKGERRLLRKLIPRLFDEGYLVAEDGGQTVRIRNFEEAQGRSSPEHEPDTNGALSEHCESTVGSLPVTEECVKSTQSLKTTAVIEERREEKKREEPDVAPSGETVPLFPERRSGEERRKTARPDGALESTITAIYNLWARAYGVRPVPHNGDKKNLAALFRKLSSAQEISHIPEWFERYLADSDPYYADKRHPVLMFLSNVDRWRAPPRAAPLKKAHASDAPLLNRTNQATADALARFVNRHSGEGGS